MCIDMETGVYHSLEESYSVFKASVEGAHCFTFLPVSCTAVYSISCLSHKLSYAVLCLQSRVQSARDVGQSLGNDILIEDTASVLSA